MLDSLADFVISWPSWLGMVFFGLTGLLFAVNMAVVFTGPDGASFQREWRRHMLPAGAVAVFAALVRGIWSPHYFTVIGQDIWALNDSIKVYPFANFTIARSPAHALLLRLYTELAGFSIPSIFFLNAALGAVFCVLVYALAFLYCGEIFCSLCAAFVAALLPSSVIGSGGVNDFAVSAVCVAVFFICLRMFSLRKTPEWFAAASCALALAAQSRFDNPLLCVVYFLALRWLWTELPEGTKKTEVVCQNIAYAALMLPYAIYSLVFYHRYFGSAPGPGFFRMLVLNLHMLRDGGALSSVLFWVCAVGVFTALRCARIKIPALRPVWIFGLVFLAIYITHEGFEPWYPMAAGSLVWTALFAGANALLEHNAARRTVLSCATAVIGVVFAFQLHIYANDLGEKAKCFVTHVIEAEQTAVPPGSAIVFAELGAGSPNNILPQFISAEYFRYSPGASTEPLARLLAGGKKAYYLPQLSFEDISSSRDNPEDIRIENSKVFVMRPSAEFSFPDDHGMAHFYHVYQITGVGR